MSAIITCKNCFNCIQFGDINNLQLKCTDQDHKKEFEKDGERTAETCKGFEPISIGWYKINGF